MKKTQIYSLIIECKSIAEMNMLSNWSNNRLVLGRNRYVTICISGVKHYFVLHDESCRERAMRWMEKHVKLVWHDLCGDDLFESCKLTPTAGVMRFVRKVVRETTGDDSIRLKVEPTIRSVKAAEADNSACA